jgi:hypothetical protein
MTLQLKDRIVETYVVKERLCKHVSTATEHVTAATVTHSIMEGSSEAVFSVGSVRRRYKESRL